MKESFLKWKTRNRLIIALAYAHRYLYPILVFVIPPTIGGPNAILFMGIGFLLLAAYTFVGYKLHWKHIFCSYQNIYRKEMTPDNIRWGMIKKSDIYAGSILFGVLGAVCLVCHFIFT